MPVIVRSCVSVPSPQLSVPAKGASAAPGSVKEPDTVVLKEVCTGLGLAPASAMGATLAMVDGARMSGVLSR